MSVSVANQLDSIRVKVLAGRRLSLEDGLFLYEPTTPLHEVGLLANLVRWTAGASVPLSVQGPGMIDCHLYQQERRLILHLVNLTSAATWRGPSG